MARTIVDLYRHGNASIPRLAHVRIGKDIETVEAGQTDWVIAGTGGVSTFSELGRGRNWWHLPVGSEYSDDLIVVNDHGNHFNWEPKVDMPLSRFVNLLALVERAFRKVS